MYENYTLAANSRCFDLIDADLFAVWEDIENTEKGTTAESWRKKLAEIARQYALSSRFALMRILCARTFHCSPSEAERKPAFAIRLDNRKTHSFESLGQYRERTALLDLLEQIASGAAEEDTGLLDALCSYEQREPFRVQINPSGSPFKARLYALSLSEKGMDAIRSLAREAADRIAASLEEIHRHYLEVLLEIAANQADAEEDWADTVTLCCRAMRDSRWLEEYYVSHSQDRDRKASAQARKRAERECRKLLDRGEALRLGHMLDFSLQEMSWFLLRVFDYEDGFRYNRSGDLIEAYGFLTGASWQQVDRWKSEYQARATDAEKKQGDIRSLDWTQAVSRSLPQMVERWSQTPDEREELFFAWLLQQAPCLDLPSRTATNVYRDLAVWAGQLISGEAAVPDSTGLRDQLEQRCRPYSVQEDAQQALYDRGDVSSQKCASLAKLLMRENKELFTFEPDLAKAWRTITTDQQGQPRLTVGGGPQNQRNRVQELLLGTLQVEKGDLLYLLWFLFSLYWLRYPIVTLDDLYNSLADYCEAAQLVLDGAQLSGFYPPHLLEQSMMLSIVLSSQDTGNPADIYAEVCTALIKPRKGRVRSKGRETV